MIEIRNLSKNYGDLRVLDGISVDIKQGEIIAVDIKKERVTVKGLNLVKRHTKPSQANPQGGIIEKEGTIHVSNVMVLDPEQKVPTRTKKVEENGSFVRVAVKSGAKL